jgi:hypothetical protein
MIVFNALLAGAIAMAYATASLFFLRFRIRTGDKLFSAFAIAFAILALGQLPLPFINPQAVDYRYFIPRLIAFAIIALAILDKNRRRR